MQDVFNPDKQPRGFRIGESPSETPAPAPQKASVVRGLLPYLNSALILLTLIIVAIGIFGRREPMLETQTSNVPLTVVVESLNGRMDAVDQALENIKDDLSSLARKARKQEEEQKSEMAAASAAQVVTPQMGASLAKSLAPKKLGQQELDDFDALINSDTDSGARVTSFLDGLESDQARSAYLDVLKRKGDEWMAAAIGSLKAGNAGEADQRYATAQYFYGIVRSRSDSAILSSQIEAKLSQYALESENQQMQSQLAAQKAELEEKIAATAQAEREAREEAAAAAAEAAAEAASEHQESAQECAERLEENRRRHMGIKDYSGTKTTPYKSDWDPDPRVREQRGIIRDSERDD